MNALKTFHFFAHSRLSRAQNGPYPEAGHGKRSVDAAR
jgi:hypothetical protein